jgi:hypothetical protein
MIEVVGLLRLIPYLMILFIAWKKGFHRLSYAIVWIIIIVWANFLFHLDPEIRSSLASVSALLLLWHTLDLKPRR